MNRRQFLASTALLAGADSPSMRRAAEELARHLAGTDIAARITLTATTAHGPEGFHLHSDGRRAVIEGGAQRGVMYGAYELLERMGFRWYAHDCTVTPRSPRLPVVDITGSPSYEYREVFIREAAGKDWAARNRLNGGHSDLDDSTGGKLSYHPFGHSFNLLVPPEKYFSTHPEYFSEVGGQRRAYNAQLCLSNRDVIRIATEQVLTWMKEHPEATLFSVSQNDEDAWCECPECRRIEEEEGAHSGPILRFVNAIAETTAARYPDKYVDTFAYRYSEKPPRRVKAHPNVRVRIAPICACEAHPYEKCPQNGFVMDNLRGWSRVTNKIYVWHYIVNFNQYLMPFPNFDEVGEDLAMYRRNNVVGLFLQGGMSKGGGTELAELRSWLLARLLWNPAQDPKALIREFTHAYYGPAAPAMLDYIDAMHRDIRAGKSMFLYRQPDFSPAFLGTARDCFARMTAAATGDYARRVDKARLALEWMDVYQAKRFYLSNNTYGPKDPAQYWARFNAIAKRVRSYGITDYAELGGIEEYEADEHRFVKAHPVARISNGRARVTLVPGFQGRVVEFADMKRNVNAVRPTEPDERFSFLEALGGLVLFAHPEQFSRPRYDITWTVEPSTDDAVMRLTGACDNGLRLTRTLTLRPDSLRLDTVTTVRNAGTKAVPVCLHSRVEVNPGDLENPTVDFAYPRANSTEYTQRIFPPPDMPLGDLFLGGDAKPANTWRLTNPSLGFTLVNHFDRDTVDRCRLWWRGRRQGQANLGLWSPQRTLQPGESMELKADYEIL